MENPRSVPTRLEDAFVSLLFNRTPRHPIPLPSRHATTQDDASVVEVKDLYRYFGDFAAVKNVSFSVHKGEIFGLLGANGAGKSTTFRMLCGLLPSSSGTLRVAGVDLRTATAAARARIGYVSQKFSLYGSLSVQQNLSFFAAAYGLGNQRKKHRMAWALEDLELKDYATMNAGTLPLGYKQRLALACALMHEPSIVFLDEPTSGVDPLARREFWARVNALAGDGDNLPCDHPLYGGGRILRSSGLDVPGRSPGAGFTGRDQEQSPSSRSAETEHGRRLYLAD